jgi:outer membrane protein OmpA-like peptidoglycan-associated protein
VFVFSFSLSGCAWMGDMVGKAKNLLKPKPTATATEEAKSDRTVVADTSARSPVAGGPGSHLQTAEGKAVTNGYGDCVNLGYSVASGDHPADCDKQGLNVAQAPVRSDADAKPARRAEPAPEPAAEKAAAAPEPQIEGPATDQSAGPAVEPTPGQALESGSGASGPALEEAAKEQPAPAETAAAAAPAAAPTYEKIALQGDALFRFGKYDEKSILETGKKRLDELAAHINEFDKASIESIVVVGHADRLGKKAANQRLSERRATTVKNYLVKQGIDSTLVKSSGKGSSEPVAQCSGGKKSTKLVKCLEPNRRVEVVIRGQKEKVSQRD